MGEEWHNLEHDEVLWRLHSSHDGLPAEEARKRHEKYGPNELREGKKISPLRIFLNQFKNVFIILLLSAVVISMLIGEVVDGILIFIIVAFAALLGFTQEYKAERAMDALKKLAAPKAQVLRNGREVEVPARELVPGDVIMLRTGSKIPADARLVEAHNLKVDEATLTGESVPVEKRTRALKADKPPLGDRNNMVYMGTAVSYGRGKGAVVSIGMETEFGKIAGMLQEFEEKKTPLQLKLDRMGKTFLKVTIVVVFVLAVLGLVKGEDLVEMFIWAISVAIAIVPEALPAVVVISLALGVRRMVKRNALIRKLPAVETLGSTTIICSDKTGTLTQDKMMVRRLVFGGRLVEVSGVGYEPRGELTENGKAFTPDEHARLLLSIAALCNDAVLVKEEGWTIKGDATEGALVVAAAKAGLDHGDLQKRFPRTGEVPFTSERKRMTTLHSSPEESVAYSKGAVEVILASCDRLHTGAGERGLTEADRREILENARESASRALRVLGFSYKRISGDAAEPEKDMVFVGFVGMLDPPRHEAKEAIRKCLSAGIKTVMITGDHKLTAVAIARELGMLRTGLALEGAELERMSDGEFDAVVENVEVYARVSPEHKLRIVRALRKKGHVIAMTGDGINDAPALKNADVGIAMGITGTDVTKEAADMILTNDNFASIVDAVEEGRGIYGNIKKYLMYLLSSNVAEVLILSIAILAGLPLPLVAIQILYINLATDGLPAIALSIDPPEPDIMQRTPRDPKEGIFPRPVFALMITGALWMAGICLVLYYLVNAASGETTARAMLFVTVILMEFFKAFNFRSDRHSVVKVGLLRNRWLVGAVLWEFFLLLLIVYLPFLQGPFNTFSMGPVEWGVAFGIALTIFPVLEAAKFAIRRGWCAPKGAG